MTDKIKSEEIEPRIQAEKTELENIDPEKLKELLIQARQEIENLQQKNDGLEKTNKDLKEQNWQLRFDGLMGLERRLVYFTRINGQIEQLIKSKGLNEILEKDSLEEEDLKQLMEVPLLVTSLDLGYLSKYNEDPEITQHYGGGHGAGDEVLRQTGALMQEIDTENQKVKPKLRIETSGYRLGGDELSLIHQLTKAEAKKVVKEFVIKHSNIEIPGADLPPIINGGTAHFSEAIEAFIEAMPKEKKIQLNPEEKAKTIQKFLTDIADRRAKRVKIFERIKMMVNLLRKKPEIFKRNFSYLQKGALRLEQEKFEELSQLQEKDPDTYTQKIKEIIDQGLETKHREDISREEKEYKIITSIADREELE